jgi:hypothetical protein
MRTIIALLSITIFATQAAAQTPTLAKELGIKVGMHYSLAKSRLLRLGWEIDNPENSVVNFPEAPELGCLIKADPDGSVLCAVGFIKNNRGIILWVVPNKKHLIVSDFFNGEIDNGHVR